MLAMRRSCASAILCPSVSATTEADRRCWRHGGAAAGGFERVAHRLARLALADIRETALADLEDDGLGFFGFGCWWVHRKSLATMRSYCRFALA